MPLKQKPSGHKYPKHYTKVYWPYIPLVVIMSTALWLGAPMVAKSQRSVLAYSTSVGNESLLTETNQKRADSGDGTLKESTLLDQAAQAKANDMVARDYWSHNTPDGKAPWIFIDQAGYQYHKAGENLAYGFTSSKDVVNGWMNSPTHRANLLDNGFTEVGFGVATSQNYQKTGPETIVVTFYGEPGSHSPLAASTVLPGAVQGFATGNSNKDSQNIITRAQALTQGHAPWITFALGVIAGIGLAYLLIKHTVRVHKTVRKGEKFVIQHPLLDITILASVALVAILCQHIGIIR